MRSIAFIAVCLLAACNSNRQPPPKPAAGTKSPDHGRILISDQLGCGGMSKYVRPVYPKEARKDRLHGTVRFRVLITKAGEVTEMEVLSGDSVFIPAATDAVKQWRYVPCRLNGELVEVRSTIDIPFTLDQ